MKTKVLILLLVIVLIYTVLGGVMFHYIESPTEEEIYTDTIRQETNFLDLYPCVSEKELKRLIKTVIEAYDKGVLVSNDSSESNNWNIPNSIFFSSTVITTIGYGHISPATNVGKAVCVIYALIGIPLMLVILSAVGEKLMGLYDRLDAKLSKERLGQKTGKVLRCLVIIGLGCVLLIFIPAAIFTVMEDWSYGTSLYYTMITLSTIGFGDYVVGTSYTSSTDRGIYRLCVSCWIIIGLAWFATVISAIQDLMTSRVDRLGHASEDTHENAKVSAQSERENGVVTKNEISPM